MNTRSKRASSIALLLPFVLAPVLPDGAIGLADRQHTAHVYSGLAPASTTSGDGSSAGVATVTGVGAATAATAGTSAGAATASGVGASTHAGAGESSGVGTCAGVGAATHATAGTASGSASVSGLIQDANTVPLPQSINVVGRFYGALQVVGREPGSIEVVGRMEA